MVTDLSLPPETQEEQLEYWLQFLSSKMPKASVDEFAVLLVGTKLDILMQVPHNSRELERRRNLFYRTIAGSSLPIRYFHFISSAGSVGLQRGVAARETLGVVQLTCARAVWSSNRVIRDR